MSLTAEKPLPPKLGGHRIMGPLPSFRKDAIGTVMEGFRQLGGVYRFAGPIPMHVVSGPEGVKHILEDNAENYQHPAMFSRHLRVVLGDGVITSEGKSWMEQRRIIQPTFHKDAMPAFGTIMTEHVARLVDEWQPRAERGETIDVRREMTKLALTILMRSLFGADWSGDAENVADWTQIEIAHVGNRIRSAVPIPENIPTASNRKFVEARDAMDAKIYSIISERRASSVPQPDLLGMLIEARDADTGERMTDKQIRDEIMTLFIAGHDTTASALTWIFYLLSKNPAAGEQHREEIQRVLAGRTPTMDDVRSLPYNRNVIQEALRLYPPLWALPRSPIKEDEVDGYRIKPGVFIMVIPFVSHRNPAYWPNPEGFDPDRFLPENSANRPKYAYYPFAGGLRACLGYPFTMLEMQLALATIAQRFRLDLQPGYQVTYQTDISLNPRHGMPMLLRPLEAAGEIRQAATGS